MTRTWTFGIENGLDYTHSLSSNKTLSFYQPSKLYCSRVELPDEMEAVTNASGSWRRRALRLWKESVHLNGSWGSRVVPQGRLDQHHDTYPGTNRMKILAHSYVWWPSLVVSKMRSFKTCQTNRHSPPPKVP